jgi:hypothetical protein
MSWGALADDVRTTTPLRGVVENMVTSPLVANARVGTPPRIAEVVGTSAGDVGVMASPAIVDVDPIRSVPGGDEGLVGDQPQIDLAPRGPETSGAKVPASSSSSPKLPRRTINWDHTPWKEDWCEDNEDMQALRTSIVTINHALTVSVLQRVVVACLYVVKVFLTILSCLAVAGKEGQGSCRPAERCGNEGAADCRP